MGGRAYGLTFEAREDVFPRVSRWCDLVAGTLRVGPRGDPLSTLQRIGHALGRVLHGGPDAAQVTVGPRARPATSRSRAAATASGASSRYRAATA
jgi:hypothetical protein